MILGLDVGDIRVGVAITSPVARLPRPLTILKNDEAVYDEIARLSKAEQIKRIVVGLPRDQEGGETAQSQKAREFADSLSQKVDLEIVFADESLSSVRATEANLPPGRSAHDPLDDIAACFILEEFLHNETGSK